MNIKITIKNNFGEFNSLPININDEEYEEIIEMSKNFYLTGGYEMQTDEGFLVIPPDIVSQSILLVQIIED